MVISLDDKLSRPSREVERRLQSLRDADERNRRSFERSRATFTSTAVAAVAVAAALSAPIKAASDFQGGLEDVRQTAELTREQVEGLGESYRQAGLDTAQGADKILEANKAMVASGALTPDQAAIASFPVGKAATAYGANIADVAGATTSMIQNLNLAVEDTSLALDYLAKSGKLGSFELIDMAREFPAVTSQAAALGMAGLDAAASLGVWLQIARKGKATGSEAATAMQGFMQQLVMPATVERFKEEGVDVIAEIKAAAEAGADPIAHIVGILNNLTGGDATKLTNFFREEGALSFAQQATKHLEEFKAMRDQVYGGAGTVEKDFISRMETPGAIMARFMASVQELQLTVGDELIPGLMQFVTAVTPMVDGVSAFVKANGELTAAVIQITAALVGLRLLVSAGGMITALLGLNGGAPAAAASTGGAVAGWTAAAAAWATKMAGYAVVGAPGIIADQAIGGPNSMEEYDAQVANQGKIKAQMWDWIDGILGKEGNGGEGLSAQVARISALQAEIAKIESGNFAVQPVELNFLKAELEELEAQVASSGDTIVADLASTMERLRLVAAAGITIPIRTGGAAIPSAPDRTMPGFSSGGFTGNGSPSDIAGYVHGREFVMNAAATARHGGLLSALNSGISLPSMSAMPGSRAAPGGQGDINVTVGDIHLSNPTNANPEQIASAIGRQIAKQARSSFSNAGMGI